jgi:ribosomal protein S18 acetylase RimI-like enzyme
VFLVAEQNGQVIGEGIALVRRHRKGKTGRIYSLAVAQQFRGKKVGRQLLRAMLDRLRQQGVGRIYLEVEDGNSAAISLYERSSPSRIAGSEDNTGAGRAARRMVGAAETAAGQ